MSPTIAFLPGTLCDARVWMRCAQALALPQTMANPFEGDTIAAMASAVLRSHRGRLIPVGSSMGAMVAFEMWRQAPERIAGIAVVGINPDTDSPERRDAREKQLAVARTDSLDALARTHLAPAWFHTPTRELADLASAMAVSVGLARFEAQAAALAGRSAVWPLLPDIDVPVLVAYGAHDRICPPEWHARMAGLLPRMHLQSVAGAGHLAPLEQPVRCAQMLGGWLSSFDWKAA